MDKERIGIIGGTGLGEILLSETSGEMVSVDTPFGPPSSQAILANWEGVDVAFLSRHGSGHTFHPSSVPYRANVWALKKIGVRRVIASGATGSLREEIEPGHLVVCDQVIDKTHARVNTFFDEGLAVHVEMGEPFCPSLRALLNEAGKHVETTVHQAGTYVCMEGPQFSTRAESNMHRQWGGDLIGMTCMPEAKLAREAELCYALIALPTDYDCWRPHDPSKAQTELMTEILGNLKRATDNAVKLIREALRIVADQSSPPPCHCQNALQLGIWTDKSKVSTQVRQGLEPLIGRYFADNT